MAMMLSFAACGLPVNIRGDVTPNPATNAPTEATAEATTEATTEPVVTEPQFDIGSTAGGTYKNAFIGIQCTLDENWTFKTDEEIQAHNEATLGLMGDAYKEALANATVVYDMMATHVNGMDTINVVMEKLSAAALLITEEQYLNLSKDGAVGGLQSMGFTIDSAEVVKLQFAGAEHYALNITGSYAGVPIYETLVAMKCNGYIVGITVATWLENTCADVLNQFQPYN